MDSSPNIFCKIELIKKGIHSLHLNIHLNPEAPNIHEEHSSITWTPTIEEQDFLIDVLSLIEHQKKNKHMTFSTRTQINTKDTLESQIDNTLEQNTRRNLQKEDKKVDTIDKRIEQILN